MRWDTLKDAGGNAGVDQLVVGDAEVLQFGELAGEPVGDAADVVLVHVEHLDGAGQPLGHLPQLVLADVQVDQGFEAIEGPADAVGRQLVAVQVDQGQVFQPLESARRELGQLVPRYSQLVQGLGQGTQCSSLSSLKLTCSFSSELSFLKTAFSTAPLVSWLLSRISQRRSVTLTKASALSSLRLLS